VLSGIWISQRLPVVYPTAPSGHSTSYWPCHFLATSLPGSPCCITSRKTDSHQYNTVIPPAQHSFIPPPPSITCCASTRPVRPLCFLLVLPLPCHIPSEYKYTDTSQPKLFFLHLPRKMEPIEGSETSAFEPQTPGKYPKENILHRDSFHESHSCSIEIPEESLHTVSQQSAKIVEIGFVFHCAKCHEIRIH
jgi:hypothetical protein